MMCCVTADTSSRRTQCLLLVACSVTLDGEGCRRRALASTASRACAPCNPGACSVTGKDMNLTLNLTLTLTQTVPLPLSFSGPTGPPYICMH